MAVRVLHVGDVHLGIDLYGRHQPERGYSTRVQDFLDRLDEALALRDRADVILFAGDIYKHPDPSATLQREFAVRVRQAAREKPIVILPGNHDVPQAWARASSVDIFAALEIEGIHVARRMEPFVLETAGGPLIVAPLPYLPRSFLATQEEARGRDIPGLITLLEQKLHAMIVDLLVPPVAELRERHGSETPAVLLAHWIVGAPVFGGYGHGNWLLAEPRISLGWVADPVFDYVALGHIHRQQCLNPGEHPPVVYAGSIERIDFGEEAEEKGVVLAEVARGRCRWEVVPLAARRFLTLRVRVRDHEEPLDAIRAAIERHAAAIPGAIVRIVYTLGHGRPPVREAEVRALLREAWCVAGIRRELPEAAPHLRHPAMTTRLSPLAALEQYLALHPELEGQKPELLAAAQALIAEVRAEAMA